MTRLSDAKFFWENDRKLGLGKMLPKLDAITFHEKLGTQGERVQRLMKLARELAPLVGADPDKAERAAQLCKADLVSETVGEFPELQGIVGRYLALEHREDPEVADAIAEHYKPAGQSDSVPTSPVAIAVALADKLDILIGFWAINEKPTGSKDPFGLRRSALGSISLILENAIRIHLSPGFVILGRRAMSAMMDVALKREVTIPIEVLSKVGSIEALKAFLETTRKTSNLLASDVALNVPSQPWELSRASSLLSFLADRLKVHLREQGVRHDLIDAVFALPGQDDLLMIVRRVEALGRFLESDDGANLLAGVKRAQNILRIEENKDKRSFEGEPDAALFAEPQEKALAKIIGEVTRDARKSLEREDFGAAMSALAKLRAPVDAFFDKVTVNAPDAALRENRLKLLAQIRAATLEVADFSKIEG